MWLLRRARRSRVRWLTSDVPSVCPKGLGHCQVLACAFSAKTLDGPPGDGIQEQCGAAGVIVGLMGMHPGVPHDTDPLLGVLRSGLPIHLANLRAANVSCPQCDELRWACRSARVCGLAASLDHLSPHHGLVRAHQPLHLVRCERASPSCRDGTVISCRQQTHASDDLRVHAIEAGGQPRFESNQGR